MELKIINLQKKIPLKSGFIAQIRQCARETLKLKPKITKGEVSLCFLDRRRIRQLNRAYLKRDAATDVIAFNLESSSHSLEADIAISCDAALINAKIFKSSPRYELLLYACHGILHTLGYDDKMPKERIRMHLKAREILKKLKVEGICPYIKPRRWL